MPLATISARSSQFLPVPAPSRVPSPNRPSAEDLHLPVPAIDLARELKALGEAIFAGDLEDARKRLDFFNRTYARLAQGPDLFWRELEKAAPGRLRERSERGLLEAAIETPGIPWKETDKHLLFLARALQDGEQGRAEAEKQFFFALYENGQPLYRDLGLVRAYDFAAGFCNRLEWENPYASKSHVNEAIAYVMNHLAAAVSQALSGVVPLTGFKFDEVRDFFHFLHEEPRLMFAAGLAPGLEGDGLTESEEQYLGSNAIFYRQMMANGYLTLYGNIVLGTLALLKDESARNKLLTAQYRNIRSIARKYDTPGIERVDMIQTAWIGLQKALQVYEPWQGTLFWNIARKWVFGAIILEFKKTFGFLRMTEPVQELEGETYQEALESLIVRRGLAPGVNGADDVLRQFNPEEAREFVQTLVPLLDEHDKSILMAWMKEPNIVKVAEQLGTSKQNISNALGRVQQLGRKLAHERRLMPQATWERFRRAELAAQSQRLLDYAEKKAAGSGAGQTLRLKALRKTTGTLPKPAKKLRPLLAAEKAALLSITQRHFDEDDSGKAKAAKHFQEFFLSGSEEQVRHYLNDLAQRLDFDSDSFKEQFINLAILEVFQSLSWKYKAPALADAVLAIARGKIRAEKDPPYTDVIIAAHRFLKTFPARNKTTSLDDTIEEALRKLPMRR